MGRLLLIILLATVQADAAVIQFQRTQDSIGTPFEALRNPDYNGQPGTLTSENAQDAIEEAVFTAPGRAARVAVTFGSAGNTNNKYLEYFRSVPSNQTPHVFAEASTLSHISCATSTSSSNDIQVRINDVTQFTLGKTGLTEVSTMSIAVAQEDKLSLKIVSGSGKDPVCTVFYRVVP